MTEFIVSYETENVLHTSKCKTMESAESLATAFENELKRNGEKGKIKIKELSLELVPRTTLVKEKKINE